MARATVAVMDRNDQSISTDSLPQVLSMVGLRPLIPLERTLKICYRENLPASGHQTGIE